MTRQLPSHPCCLQIVQVKSALAESASNKSCGLGGLQITLYTVFYNNIQGDFREYFKKSINIDRFSSSIRETLRLIP